jgi:hypothetical protein
LSTPNTLNGSKSQFSLEDLMKALADTSDDRRPVERWNPEHCGEIDIIIKSDGSWWHEGTRITRKPLVNLFASVLRKDEDGQTYLVTPAEKLTITVERAHFIAVRMDAKGVGQDQRLFFTTNMDDVIEVSEATPIRVETDPETGEPDPYVGVWGRLEASLSRPVFYELVDLAVERETPEGTQLGVWASGAFYPLGPAGSHEV